MSWLFTKSEAHRRGFKIRLSDGSKRWLVRSGFQRRGAFYRPENDREQSNRLLAHAVGHARRFAEVGTTTCAICGADPGAAPPLFTTVLPCGHGYGSLVWTRRAPSTARLGGQ